MRLASHFTTVGPWHVHHVQTTAEPSRSTPVILVHGLNTSHRYMRPLAGKLGPHHHTYAPDLPGFGKSSKPSNVLTVEEMADALAAWMRALETGPAHLIGNSLGCNVIVETCIRHPGLVRRIVLQGPTVAPRPLGIPRLVFEWFRNGLREPSTGTILFRDYLDAGPRRALVTLSYQLGHRIEDRLPHVGHPALVVRGTRDSLATAEWTRHCADLLRSGSYAEVEGAGHTANLFSAASVAALARDFFEPAENSAETADAAAKPAP